MKIKSEGIIIFPLLVLSFWLSSTVSAKGNEISENTYKRLTAVQCDSLIKSSEINPNFVILDVRTPSEWENYHLTGSINRSTGLSDFTAQLDALPKQKIFLLHCQSGGRSAGAFAKMKELGFAEVYEMIGGINAWNSKGFPTTKVTQPKLMLVSYSDIRKGTGSDTVKVTITNRANGNLTFSSFSLSDIHNLQNDFNAETILDGAQDYTFSIIHSPGYNGEDSTKIAIESNGGLIDLNIVFKNGSVVGVKEQQMSELSLYPNPVNNILYLKNTEKFHFEEISIFNIAGQKIKSFTLNSVSNGIDVSGIKNGIYIMQLKTGGKMFSKKFIVKH